MRIEVSENEKKDELRFKASETEEMEFTGFMEENTDTFNQKVSQSSIKRMFNIFDAHLKVYLDLI